MIARIGRKERLGLYFGNVLYPRRLGEGEAPDLKVPPKALDQGDAIDRLLRCIVHFEVYIFPHDRQLYRAVRIRAWLQAWAEIWFERHDVDTPLDLAMDLVRQLRVLEAPPGTVLERLVDGSHAWPDLVELAMLDAQRDSVGRIIRAVHENNSA